MKETHREEEGCGRVEYVCSRLEFNKVFFVLLGGIKKLYTLPHRDTLKQGMHVNSYMHAIHIIAVVENNVTLDLRSSCGAVK